MDAFAWNSRAYDVNPKNIEWIIHIGRFNRYTLKKPPPPSGIDTNFAMNFWYLSFFLHDL